MLPVVVARGGRDGRFVSVVMTCSTSRENGAMPVVGSYLPMTFAWWTS
jgi:hypothetical protein